MASKIKIKLGPVEVEYEGSEEFLKEELFELLTAVSRLYKDSGIVDLPAPSAIATQPVSRGVPVVNPIGTIGNIAAKLQIKSGSELVIAAAAKLIIGEGKGSFTRDELLTEMKRATSYYKKTYSNNLTKYLSNLVKTQKLIETAKNTYSLKASTKEELERCLAS